MLEADLRREARDHAGARAATEEALRISGGEPGLLRYLWPVLWAGVRSETERSLLDGAPADPALVAQLGSLDAPTPPLLGYRTLAEAELAPDPVHWAAAVDAWRPVGWPWQLAYALVRLAEASADAGEVQAAAEPLTEGWRIADGLGAEPIAARARRLAQRARIPLGEAPPIGAAETDPLARYGLTEREREVLLLLAAGRSNPEIAAELYISAKTASTHVSNLLAKLRVEGRVQAAGLVHRLGLGLGEG
ncbi:MAG: response regulator transcription factor [Microbacteriaceae bacterium]|nr:response regulator transcription factor [Microbacteriaceae bacterium]